MINLSQYLTESLLLEFKADLGPQTVIVMGGPGAGKTYWMKNSASQFFKRELQAKQLDSDNNLVVVQRENCEQLAEDILLACSRNSSSQYNTQKETFHKFIEKTQTEYNEQSEKNGSPLTELDKIDYKFCKAWIDRYDRASEDNKDKVVDEFKRAFMKEYFKTVFASDFSRRNVSKAQYKRDFADKLGGVMRDEENDFEFVGPQDVIVAITGDKIQKIDEIVDASKDMGSTVSIVYLNIPEERSVKQDAQRDRSVGAEMIHSKLEDIHKTWDELTKSFQQHGIFRMWEMVPGPRTTDKTIAWTVEKAYINKQMIGR